MDERDAAHNSLATKDSERKSLEEKYTSQLADMEERFVILVSLVLFFAFPFCLTTSNILAMPS